MNLCEKCKNSGIMLGGASFGDCEMGRKCKGTGRVPNTLYRICDACSSHYGKCQMCGKPLSVPGLSKAVYISIMVCIVLILICFYMFLQW